MTEPATYLITGASSDIGCELIRQLAAGEMQASEDITLIACAHSGTARLQALAAENDVLASRMKIMSADLSIASDLEAQIGRIRREHGFPTHLVHLAASRVRLTRVTEINWNGLASDLEVQVRSLSALFRSFLPSMAKSGRRCKVVVMLSSVTLGATPKFMAQYVVAKYALLGLFRAAVAEYSNTPICINAVSPSMVDTQFLSNIPRKYVEMAAAAHPAGKLAAVADVVPTLRFLLSSQSDYISGANVPVTAGGVV